MAKYKKRAPLAWYLTESMAASWKNGMIVTWVRRPHPPVWNSIDDYSQLFTNELW
jgi:hypothetical protein